MNVAHEPVGSRRQDRERAALQRCTWTPCVPDSGDAHDGIRLQVDLEGTFARPVGLPFVETADQNDVALPDYEITKQRVTILEDPRMEFRL